MENYRYLINPFSYNNNFCLIFYDSSIKNQPCSYNHNCRTINAFCRRYIYVAIRANLCWCLHFKFRC